MLRASHVYLTQCGLEEGALAGRQEHQEALVFKLLNVCFCNRPTRMLSDASHKMCFRNVALLGVCGVRIGTTGWGSCKSWMTFLVAA